MSQRNQKGEGGMGRQKNKNKKRNFAPIFNTGFDVKGKSFVWNVENQNKLFFNSFLFLFLQFFWLYFVILRESKEFLKENFTKIGFKQWFFFLIVAFEK